MPLRALIERTPTSPATSKRFVLAASAASVAYAFEFAGAATDALYSLLMLGAVVAIGVGLRRNRPNPRRAWRLMLPISFLFALGISVRDATGQNRDLAKSTILPDLLTVPGYLLFALMLVLLIRSRQAGRTDGVLLDGMMFAVGSFLVFYVALISPVFANSEFTTFERITFSIYPPLSAVMALLASRLAFTPGRASLTLRYFLVGVWCLFLGDITQFLSETGTVDFPLKTLDLPYAIAYAFVAAAYLHPSIRRVASESAHHAPAMPRLRLVVVAGGILTPCFLLLMWQPRSRSEQTFVGLLAASLAAIGAIRMIVAIRAQARSEAAYAHRATHDALTGLPNRELLLERIADSLHAPTKEIGTSVLLIDIDRFKLINDTLGHRAGDELLLACAQRVVEAVGDDGIVGRISGDEFIVLVRGRPLAEATHIAERIRASFSAPLATFNNVYITVSLGVAHTTDPSVDPVDLLREADTAVYRSKDAGRDTITLYTPEMLEVDERRFELEHALRDALGAGALEVHYQPIVSLATGRVEGFEALARWRNGDVWVPPIEFVSVAEDSGLIGQLGTWVLRESVRQLARWRSLPELATASVSVNLSARQLTPDLADLIDDTLRSSGLPGEALWLEITESMMVHDSAALQDLIEQIRELGVRLSLDDFGTGFSSLAYLRQYPLDRLKIDRSFVTNLSTETAHGSLADAIIGIGRSLRIGTVAEGIETKEEALALWSLGCPYAQGYYFAKPMPASQVPVSLNAIRVAWSKLDLRVPAAR